MTPQKVTSDRVLLECIATKLDSFLEQYKEGREEERAWRREFLARQQRNDDRVGEVDNRGHENSLNIARSFEEHTSLQKQIDDNKTTASNDINDLNVRVNTWSAANSLGAFGAAFLAWFLGHPK